MTHRADASNLLDNRGYVGPLIRGQNPALLIETATRDRITDSLYWKEQCFALNAATLLDRAVELTYIGGTYGVSMKPSPFLCLAFKLLTIVPDKEIVMEYLERGGEEWKYLKALAVFYVRLTFDAGEVFGILESVLEDKRKLKRRRKEGWVLTYMDEFVDELLHKERSCGTSLWKLPNRQTLEDMDVLEVRVSPLQEELDKLMDEDGMDGRDNDNDVRVGSEGEGEEGVTGCERERRIDDTRDRDGSASEEGRSVDGRGRGRSYSGSESPDD